VLAYFFTQVLVFLSHFMSVSLLQSAFVFGAALCPSLLRVASLPLLLVVPLSLVHLRQTPER